jgi:hypothetical protein
MKKLYYDCPLQAAYMAKEFGVSFTSERGYIVAPDSHHIFEPQEGDKDENGFEYALSQMTSGFCNGTWGREVIASNQRYFEYLRPFIGKRDIASRGGKPFFMPLVADE